MALSIKDEETDALVRKLAARKNLSMTQAVKLAVNNELERTDAASEAQREEWGAAIRKIQERVAARPDRMSAEEIDAWMYDENGLPH